MKERVQELFKIIKDARQELEDIRSTCKHETSHEANYSEHGDMRRIQVGEMCDVCHKFLRETKPFEFTKVKSFNMEDIKLPKGSLLDSLRKSKKDDKKNSGNS